MEKRLLNRGVISPVRLQICAILIGFLLFAGLVLAQAPEGDVSGDVSEPQADDSADDGATESDDVLPPEEDTLVEDSEPIDDSVDMPVDDQIELPANDSEALYVDIDEVTQEINESAEEVPEVMGDTESSDVYVDIDEVSDDEDDEVTGPTLYELYKDNKKEIVTVSDDGQPEIFKEESAFAQEEETLVKEVIVFSDEHYDNELTVYSDIIEGTEDRLSIYWNQAGEHVSFKTYDYNGNGLADRVSWEIPHLSEQTFDIIVNFTTVGNDSEDLVLDVVSVPESVTLGDTEDLEFSFNMSYSNPSLIGCNFEITTSAGDPVYSDAVNDSLEWFITDLQSFSAGVYNWSLMCQHVTDAEISASLGDSFEVLSAPAEPTITFDVTSTSVSEGQSVSFTIDMDSDYSVVLSYNLSYGDGNVESYNQAVTGDYDKTYSHSYGSDGSYLVTFIGYIDGESFALFETITVTDTSTADTSSPVLTLIKPDDGAILGSDDIEFTYNVSDNVGVANCTFELYYYNESVVGTLVYNTTDTTVANGETLVTQLSNFDEGDYLWDVVCYDTSGNHRERTRDFTYDSLNASAIAAQNAVNSFNSLNADPYTDDVSDLIIAINDFYAMESDFDTEQRAVIDALGLDSDLKLSKKLLLQFSVDLENNLQFMEESKRTQRRNEIIDQIQDIKSKVPTSIEVYDSYEFQKNTINPELDSMIKEYLDAKGIVLKGGALRAFVKGMVELQSTLQVTTSIRSAHIEFVDGEETLTIITKELESANDGLETLVEVIPTSFADSVDDVVFLPESDAVSDTAVEYAFDSLEDMRFTYYVEGRVSDLKVAEQSETFVIGTATSLEGGSIGALSGFVSAVSIGDGGVASYFVWVILLVGGVAIAGVSYQRVQVNRMKQQHGAVREMHEIIDRTKEALSDKDVAIARDHYHQACVLYPHLPEKSRPVVYKRIQKLLAEIDRKDAVGLIREFIEAVRADQHAYAVTLYGKIQSLYDRLPKRFRTKAFQKMRPYIRKLRRSNSSRSYY